MQPWQDQIITKKTSGKDELSVKDMVARSGIEEGHLRTLIKHKRLQSVHFTKSYAADGVLLDSESQKKVEANVIALTEKSKGIVVNEKERHIREMATSIVINDARQEGRPIHFKYQEKSAEENFDNRLKSPFGKAMYENPKFIKETKNVESGGTWDEGVTGLVAMPENYDQVLWNHIRDEAARLNTLAITGDKEAAEKYKILQAAYPDQLPHLKLEAKEKGK